MVERQYPCLKTDIRKLSENAKAVVSLCTERGIDVAGVVKGFNGIEEPAFAIYKAGVKQIASSRLEQIEKLKTSGMDADFMLIRIPMLSEAEYVAELCDISLESETDVIKKIDACCRKRG